MNRVPSCSSVDFSSTPPMSAGSSYATSSTAQSVFYPQPHNGHYLHPVPPQHYVQQGQMRAPGGMMFHETPQGRVAIPMHGGSQVVMMNHNQRRYTPSPNPTDDGMFEPMDEGAQLMFDSISPSHGYAPLPGHHQISPTDEIRMHHHQPNHGHHQISPTDEMRIQQHHYHQMAQRGRPPLAQRHSIQFPQQMQRPVMQRQMSLQVPQARSASPHIPHGDVFDAPGNGSPVRRPNSSLGHNVMPAPIPEPMHDMYPGNQSLGITPSRALGPAPSHPYSFNAMPVITPNDKRGSRMDPSSVATTMTATSCSALTEDSEAIGSVGRRAYHMSSDDEDNSPTRASSARLRKTDSDASRSLALSRPSRPVTRPTVIGGRTSAKFSKVAEDPGVEGVPPGPRSLERPAPSFACIIGQAILHSKAGGLSLEHIYRYVETAYPFFQKGDGAWRNSVRHNLSIHKMFETIPRTEKFPPGKGGIWIIHEDEKCHWPSEDKFIKNFPPSHGHHSQCRQTLHEAEKERQAKEKAEREGKIYVPKKAKKVKKGTARDDDDEADMMRTLSSDALFASQPSAAHLMSSVTPQPMAVPLPTIETDFMPMEQFIDLEPEEPVKEEVAAQPLSHEETLAQCGTMAPPKFGSPKPKRRALDDDENFFGAPTVKRLRISEAHPLQPIDLDHSQYLVDDLVTPERERPGMASSAMKHAQSSVCKTPGLVNTSSSPGSSPMPPTLPRATHNPSGLQQAWTREDMSSSPAAPLEGALDIDMKPKPSRKHVIEEDFIPMGPPRGGLAPKTPVTRSSAHGKPRTPMSSIARTPLGYGNGSPFPYWDTGLGSETTPQADVRGVLERMGDGHTFGSPSRSMTDPSQYSIASLRSSSPVKSRELST